MADLYSYLIQMRIWQKRMSRHMANFIQYPRFARKKSSVNLPYTCKKHQSLLRRKLGSTDPQLQENKVVNLKLAIPHLDGILIPPGKIFSFYQLVGKPTAKKGYVEGLMLSRGEVKTGIGGGLCQLANLLYWMALHTPMEVTERHHHSFDPFPDDRRVLPFGSGASLFYNYVELRFYNPTEQTFQIRVWLTDEHLKGAIYTDREWPYSYHIEERNHRFLRQNGKNYRENEIWRKVIDKRTGLKVKEELIVHNFSEVKYSLDDLLAVEEAQ